MLTRKENFGLGWGNGKKCDGDGETEHGLVCLNGDSIAVAESPLCNQVNILTTSNGKWRTYSVGECVCVLMCDVMGE